MKVHVLPIKITVWKMVFWVVFFFWLLIWVRHCARHRRKTNEDHIGGDRNVKWWLDKQRFWKTWGTCSKGTSQGVSLELTGGAGKLPGWGDISVSLPGRRGLLSQDSKMRTRRYGILQKGMYPRRNSGFGKGILHSKGSYFYPWKNWQGG